MIVESSYSMRIYLLLLIAPLFLLGCSQKSSHEFENKIDGVQNHAQENIQNTTRECSYSYFLKGNRAELLTQYDKALQYYENALLCDPESSILRARIPIILLKQGNIRAAIDRVQISLLTTPHTVEFTILLAQLYTQNNQVEDATALYQTLLQQDPDNIDILLHLGLLYQDSGLYDQAANTFNRALEVDGNSYYALLYLAQTLTLNNKPREAQEAYTIALDKNWSVTLAYEVGEFYTNNELHADALKIYDSILKYDQGEQSAVIFKIEALVKLGKIDDALAELKNRRAYSSNPEYIDLTTSGILIDQGLKKESITLLKEMVKRYRSANATHALALIYYEDAKYQEALKWLDNAPPTQEPWPQGLFIRIQIYLHQNKLTEAKDLLIKHIDDDEPILYNVLASLYIKLDQNSQAEQTYLTGLEKFPDNIDIAYEFALFLEQNQRTTEALVVMENLLHNDPSNPEVLNFLGYTWADNNIHLEKALQYTQKAASLMPDNGFILDSVGWCYYRLGRFEEAVQNLEKALELTPNDPNIYEHLADAYSKNNQTDMARKAYMTTLELYDNVDKKHLIQQKLDSLE